MSEAKPAADITPWNEDFIVFRMNTEGTQDFFRAPLAEQFQKMIKHQEVEESLKEIQEKILFPVHLR